MKFSAVRKVILISVYAGLIFSLGYFLGNYGFKITGSDSSIIKITRELPKNHQDLDFSLFWRVWDTLQSSYYDKSKIDVSKMVYGAIRGMVESVGDPYTAFLPPEENKVVEEDLSGSFEGIGIQIGFKGKNLAVIAPLPDSPAEKAGIKAGDFIVGIKDEGKKIDISTSGLSLNEAVRIIRGKAGSKVALFLVRDNLDEPIKIEVNRAKLDVPSVAVEFVDNNRIVHIRLLKFGADTVSEWEKAVSEVISRCQGTDVKCKGIILDLRNNPGGYLQSSVDIAEEFLNKDSVVVIEDKSGIKTEFKTSRSGRLTNKKVIVLINGGSASASEILAGALSEIKGYKLVGETTFGKGTIQEPIQFDKGSSLHITTARWLTPKGNWVNEKGLKPDVEIKDNTDTTQDEQLLEAIKLIN